MENPYASPPPAHDWGDKNPYAPLAGGRPRGFVGHVRVLGVLMMVQGAFDILMGLFLLGMSVFAVVMLQNDEEFKRIQAQEFSPEVMSYIVGGIYGGLGLIALVVGILNAYAGWRTFRFQSRTLGIIALSGGMVTVMTCYCAPTSIALLIYGLIVYLDSSVKEAFEMGARGHTPDQIDAAFNPYMQSSDK